MKILIIGKNNLMQWPQKASEAMKENGHETHLFLFNKRNIEYTFLHIFSKNKRFKILAKKLEREILNFNPDLIFVISCFFLPDAFWNILSKFPKIKKAAWVGDRFSTQEYKHANLLNFLFCSDTGFIQASKDFKCQTFYLPLCASEKEFSKNTNKTLPPFFVGIANPKRIEYFSKCHIPCLIYGKGWDKKRMPQHIIINRTLSHKKARALMQRSIFPINLGFSSNVINGLNFRVFEIGLSGGLITSNNSSDLKLCYDLNKEAIMYSSPDEFNELMKDILQFPEKYKAIAEAGYRKTIKEHTFQKRMQQMLELVFQNSK